MLSDTLQEAFKVMVVIFLWGSLLDMGLRLDRSEVLAGLRNLRFLLHTLIWGFVFCPALAYLITRVVPLEAPYADGIILQGLTPCAPFLALLVDRARGDLGLTAAFMMVCITGTVVLMPLLLPHLVTGMEVTPWMISKPILSAIALPVVVGILIREKSEAVAGAMLPYVKKATGIATLLLMPLILVIYGADLLASVGSYASLSLVIYFLVLATVPYWLAFGLQESEKTVLAIGIPSRNIGAAFAACLVVSGIDQRTTVVVGLSLLYMTIFALLAGKWFGNRAQAGETGLAGQ